MIYTMEACFDFEWNFSVNDLQLRYSTHGLEMTDEFVSRKPKH